MNLIMYRFFAFRVSFFAAGNSSLTCKVAELKRGRCGQKTDFRVLRRLVPYLAPIGFVILIFLDRLYLSTLFPLLDAVLFAQMAREKKIRHRRRVKLKNGLGDGK